jgi:hypothetical protein
MENKAKKGKITILAILKRFLNLGPFVKLFFGSLVKKVEQKKMELQSRIICQKTEFLLFLQKHYYCKTTRKLTL